VIRSLPLLFAVVSLVAGCGSPIGDAFEARRATLTADPGPAPSDWAPDGVLHLSPALVDALITAGLESYTAFSGEQEIAAGPVSGSAAYALTVRRVDIAQSPRCEGCVEVRTRVRGDVDYRLGGVRGSTPVVANVSLDLRVDATADHAGTWTVAIVPQGVNDVQITIADLAGAVRRPIERQVGEAVSAALSENLTPIPVGAFGDDSLPLRAMSVAATDAGGVTIALLTTSPTSAPIGDSRMKIATGWQLDLSQASLLGLAARAGMEAGAVGDGVVVEPTSLAIGRDDFTMGLRLWRPTGRGWWRDYTVTGDLGISERLISLSARDVAEVAQSPGAVLADPLAAIGESVILSAIEGAVNTSLPSLQEAQAQGMTVGLRISTASGSGDVVRIKGDLSIAAVPPSRRDRPGGRRPPAAEGDGATPATGGMARPR